MSSLQLFKSADEPWASPEALEHVYASADLGQALAVIETSAGFEDLTSTNADRVNTALSASAPISRWVRYREGYAPELVESILGKHPMERGARLLDPMCGSGSSLIAAQRLGVRSVGFDVSPFATLASRVKTDLLDDDDLACVLLWLDQNGSGPQGGHQRPADPFLFGFFPPANFEALVSIREHILASWEPGRTRDFLILGLLAILEECSNRRKDGNGLATRPCMVTDPRALFEQQVRQMAQEASASREAVQAAATVSLQSAVDFHESRVVGELGLKDEVGSVVFSPPYPNSFDYFESYKLELLFTELVPFDEFGDSRSSLVRSFRQTGTSEPLGDMPLVEAIVKEVNAALPRKESMTGTRDGRTRLVPNLLRGYFQDMRRVLRSCSSVMRPSARVHIVVDQSAYAGVPVPTDLVLADLGRQVGLELEALTLCRRAKTSGQQLQLQPRLSALLRETIVTLRKAT